mmetsp:Transcript_18615/g.16485  ORF Transcript_18615/g.16485 Transcript_18615/m.16485 type:complete len:112 (-) Transcript_18615:40-375(-)
MQQSLRKLYFSIMELKLYSNNVSDEAIKVNISDIKKPNKKSVAAFLILNRQRGVSFIPISVKGKMMCIEEVKKFTGEQVFKAILNGMNIETKESIKRNIKKSKPKEDFEEM